jgi:hypothetical protein
LIAPSAPAFSGRTDIVRTFHHGTVADAKPVPATITSNNATGKTSSHGLLLAPIAITP